MKESTPEVHIEETRDPREVLREELREQLQPTVLKLFKTAREVEEKSRKATSPEKRRKLESVGKKIEAHLCRAIYCLGFMFFATQAQASSHRENDTRILTKQTQDTVLTRRTERGVEYIHPDSETTRILNFFAGKDILSEQEIEEMLKTFLKAELEQKKLKIPHNFESMSLEHALILAVRGTINKKEDRQVNYADFMRSLKKFPRFLGTTRGIYEALWQIEREVGSPKIRFMVNNPKLNGYYNPKTNTVVINIERLPSPESEESGKDVSSDIGLSSTLFAELAHASQWQANQRESNERFSRDYKKTLQTMKSLKISPDSAKGLQYVTPGTIEHEAHSLIAPQLKWYFVSLIREIQSQTDIKTKTSP